MSAVLQRAAPAALGAFEAFGVELEYMIVSRNSLDVLPIAERILEGELARGSLAWSNELVAHVVELKNSRPTADLAALSARLQSEIRMMNSALRMLGARLMPGAMHPWMDPRRETRLWRGRGNAVYRAYDRIFDCRSHGWANLQCMHINLPFGGDGEFARLHAAIRLALPILPAIAAASPFADGRAAGALDYRLEAYRTNSTRLPQMTGEVIPEPMASRAQYERELLYPLYAALAPHDPHGLLRYEWANARGAIARFDRSAIEIRVVDSQECPAADIALAALIIDLLWFLYEEERETGIATSELARILRACIRDAERARIDSPAYLEVLSGDSQACEAAELWARLASRLQKGEHRSLWQPFFGFVLEHGPLARRLLRACGTEPSRARLAAVYGSLCECLERGALFDPSNSS
jgi:gamma-glutamyl:cysteine ligase YbdK (ATP-grasp superfamily)